MAGVARGSPPRYAYRAAYRTRNATRDRIENSFGSVQRPDFLLARSQTRSSQERRNNNSFDIFRKQCAQKFHLGDSSARRESIHLQLQNFTNFYRYIHTRYAHYKN